MPEPETALETQQRQVIKILVDRLRLEEAAAFEFKYGKDGGSGEARFMELVQATGSGKGNNLQSLDLQKQKKVLEDEIAEWNKRMIWAQTTVEARDALMERVEAAKEETEAAEATVEPLRVECRKLEKEEKKLRGEKTRLDAAKMQCERSLVTLPAELAKLREALPSLESQLKEMTSAVEPLESESEALNEKREALEKDLPWKLDLTPEMRFVSIVVEHLVKYIGLAVACYYYHFPILLQRLQMPTSILNTRMRTHTSAAAPTRCAARTRLCSLPSTPRESPRPRARR